MIKRMPLFAVPFRARHNYHIGITYFNAPFVYTQRRYTSESAIAFDCIWPASTIGATAMGDRARCEEKALLVADASSSRLRWHARGWRGQGGSEKEKGIPRSSGWGDEESEVIRSVRSLARAWLSYRPPKHAVDTAKRWNRSIFPACANRWGVALPLGAHIRSLAHLRAREIVKRKIAPVTLSNPRSRGYSSRGAPRKCRGPVPGPWSLKRLFTLLDHDGKTSGVTWYASKPNVNSMAGVRTPGRGVI